MEESEKQSRSIEGAIDKVSIEVKSVSGKTDYRGVVYCKKCLLEREC